MLINRTGGGGENVTPEVNAQTPIVESIANMYQVVGKPSGATATEDKILKGYTSYVDQTLLTGTYEPPTIDGVEMGSGDELESFDYDLVFKLVPFTFQTGYAVSYKSELHILGGTNSSRNHYKWNGAEWSNVSYLPTELLNGGVVVYNNEIHMLEHTNHYKWNGVEWQFVSSLPYAFARGSVVVYNNEIHIMGGDYSSSTYKNHYKWDGTSWVSVSTLPYSLYNGYAVVYNNEIHILGGDGGTTSHYKWDGTTWSNVSTLPYTFYSGGAAAFDGKIYLIGGSGGGGNYAYYRRAFDGTNWTTLNDLPLPFTKGGVTIHDDAIRLVGSNSLSSVHFAINAKCYKKVGV